jgi:hypothetical protein
MDSPLLQTAAYHTRRSQRWALALLAFTVVLALVALPAARTSRFSALVLLLYGVLALLSGRNLRASSKFLRLADSPAPAWAAWATGVSYVVGVLAVALGGGMARYRFARSLTCRCS